MITEARTYQELWAAFVARAEQLAMTREEMDAAAGLPSGYGGTLFAPAQVKKMGLSSLSALCGVLKLKLIVVEDGPTPKPVKPPVTHSGRSNKSPKPARNQR